MVGLIENMRNMVALDGFDFNVDDSAFSTNEIVNNPN